MFEDALRYPTDGDDALVTIAIGGVLGILGFLIVPVFLVYGYLVRVIRSVHDGDDETPPPFDEWGDLLVDGLTTFVITLVYTLVPSILFALAVVPFFTITTVSISDGGGGGSEVVGGFLVLVAFAIALLSLLLLFAAVYVIPVAVAAFATTGRLGAAFSPTHLRRIGGRGQFLTAWLVAVAISILVGIVAGIATATVLGVVLVPFLNFYGNVAAAYAIGAGVPDRVETTHEG